MHVTSYELARNLPPMIPKYRKSPDCTIVEMALALFESALPEYGAVTP
jgi:hypothetical protein